MYIGRTSSSMPYSKHLQQDQPIRPVDIKCRYHTDLNCLNYCHDNSCFKLLCAECIEQHEQHHKKNGIISTIKSFKKVREICVDKLNRLLDELLTRMSTLKQPKTPQQILQQATQKFQSIKKLMFQIIEQQLSRFHDMLKSKISQSLSTINQLQQIHENLHKIILQLKQSKSIILEGNKQIPEIVEKVLIMNQSIYIDTFNREAAGYGQKLAIVDFDVSINHGKFRANVGECLKISRSQYEESNSGDFGKASRLYPANKALLINNNSINTPTGRSKKQFVFQQKQPQIQIKQESEQKLLHFFETDSPFLHLIDLTSSSISRQKITLPNYIVPSFYASILTSHGYIFISGGIVENQNEDGEEKVGQMSKYSLKGKGNDSFKRNFAEVKPRSSHSICEFGDFLYILGGYSSEMNKNDEVQVEKTVERVNIKSGKVQLQPRCKYGGSNISVVINNSIIKASEQGIQIYSILQKKWSLLATPELYIFPKGCGWTKISKQCLLIYGGYNSNQDGIDSCKIWYLSEQEIQVKNLSACLPYKEGFLNNPGVVARGAVYVLQNVIEDSVHDDEDQHERGILQGERALLKFDGTYWTEISL